MRRRSSALLPRAKWCWSRFGDENPHAPNLAVFVETGVGALFAPVSGEAEAGDAQLLPEVLPVVRLCRAGGDRARRHDAIGIALPLVEAGAADQAEGRSLGQVRRGFSIIAMGQALWFIDPEGAFVRHERAGPQFMEPGIVFDQAHVRRVLGGFGGHQEIDSRVVGLRSAPLSVPRGGPGGQEVVVRCAGGMRDVAQHVSVADITGAVGPDVLEAGEQGEIDEATRSEAFGSRFKSRQRRGKVQGKLPVGPEAIRRSGLVVGLHHDALIGELSLEVDGLSRRRSQRAGQWSPVGAVRMNGPDAPAFIAPQALRLE